MAPGTNVVILPSVLEYVEGLGLRPGDRLPSIRSIASQLNLSVNAVRDGLKEAHGRGWVEIRPRSGVYLRERDEATFLESLSDRLGASLSQKDPNLFHLIETRTLIEAETVRVAAMRRRLEDLAALCEAVEELKTAGADQTLRALADEKFHLAIASIAGNGVQTVVLRTFLILLRPYRMKRLFNDEDRDRTLREHEQIYRCIVAGDAGAAATAMQAHILNFPHSSSGLDLETFSLLTPTVQHSPVSAEVK